MSYSPLEDNSTSPIAKNEETGPGNRNRLNTEISNMRDSSYDQINSIKDFSVSQNMINQQPILAINAIQKRNKLP